jgi:hypothetical protein
MGIVLALLALIVVTARVYGRRRQRDEEGVAIQSEIADALLMDPVLGRLAVAVTVYVPLASHAAPIAEVRGQVPSPEARDMVLRFVQRELLQHSPTAQVEDALTVTGRINAA